MALLITRPMAKTDGQLLCFNQQDCTMLHYIRSILADVIIQLLKPATNAISGATAAQKLSYIGYTPLDLSDEWLGVLSKYTYS